MSLTLICYHKEAFIMGIISALFIVNIITLFEEVIVKWLEKFKTLRHY